MIGSFLKWYGETWDLKVKIPKTLPAYVEDSDIDKLFKAIEAKRTHRSCIVCDALMTAVALKTGMRRAELANIASRDIHSDFLIVRNGKGGKDRTIPLGSEIALRLQNLPGAWHQLKMSLS